MKTKCGLCNIEIPVPADVRMSIKILDLDITKDLLVFCKDCQHLIIKSLAFGVTTGHGEDE